MKEKKEDAITRMQKQMEDDYEEGCEEAIEMVKEGEINLETAEQLVNADQPYFHQFEGKSEAYIKGFVESLEEILSEASKRMGKESK